MRGCPGIRHELDERNMVLLDMRNRIPTLPRNVTLAALFAFAIAVTFGFTAGNAHAVTFTSTVKVLDKLPEPPKGYSVPDDPNILFFLYRSKNPNTVVYAARMDGSGKLRSDTPVEAFWRRFNTNGKRKALKSSERRLAYGVVTNPASGDGQYLAHIVSYPKRKALVRLDDEGKPIATMRLGDRTVKLAYAYVDVDTGGFFPEVHRVDIYGYDIKTGEVVWEHLKPQKKKRGPVAEN